MSEQALVSIIIPTYNRAQLIGETLDSIVAQTYKYWECLVIDDGSTDNTEEVVGNYTANDARFQYQKRSEDHLPGGNGARNYGFKLSTGKYIQWFDSDDLMTPNALEIKVREFETKDLDVVVSKSQFFDASKEFYHYQYTSKDINFESFAMGNVSWVTDDFMVKRKLASHIGFNEKLTSGQEYNYCCKLLTFTESVGFIDMFLTKRRDTVLSIGKERSENRLKYLQSRFTAYWTTYQDISYLIEHPQFERFSLLTCASCYLRSGNKIILPKEFHKALWKSFGFKKAYFVLARWSNRLVGRYYVFFKKLKKGVHTENGKLV